MKNIRIITIAVTGIVIGLLIIIKIYKATPGYLYGNSLRQNEIINTVRLHKYGITGERINIGLLGAGFYTLHPVFKHTKVVKEYDFYTRKPTTLNYNHIKGMDHGTNVFSVLGGYEVNELIGIAYGANFILAKSDISTDRLVREEANAIEAAGWLYENGAKIITTSLSFNKFDNADYYYPSQMNGTTAAITRSADSLARKGVVFCCSAGNNYEEEWHIIEPPADGFNVLAVGSIDKNLVHSFFSSCGPTADGRIKPDLVAPGEGVWCANYLPKIKPDFGWSHGTSLAAPMVAGTAALVLSTHPDLSSAEVIEAIKNTSSKSDSPDNLYGWGVPDAEKAVSYFGPAFSNTPDIETNGGGLRINTYVFSTYGIDKQSVEVHYSGDHGKGESFVRMKESGDYYYTAALKIDKNSTESIIYFQARDLRGFTTRYPSGILGNYFVLKTANEKVTIFLE